ncbi:hypothetical protein RhiirC2_786681 [Rhizophagus irregularis]|uniref:SWIM-type domain-containing protein n=1 Tax=Rhizophagus irregularis TaxID=588596 RepID=A0A2N1MTW8_9GLOM|nr:hypothetical protein RhiirC2_786681 [Rhizophagus irregularis]
MEIYSIQKAQLDICLEYNAMLILMEEYEAFEKNDVQETDNLNIDDQVDFAQISLKSLIGKVNRTNIVEIWRITYLTHKQNSTSHFVILLHDESHICTCLIIFNHGLVCRHFFQIMIRSQKAKFSISLIKK